MQSCAVIYFIMLSIAQDQMNNSPFKSKNNHIVSSNFSNTNTVSGPNNRDELEVKVIPTIKINEI